MKYVENWPDETTSKEFDFNLVLVSCLSSIYPLPISKSLGNFNIFCYRCALFLNILSNCLCTKYCLICLVLSTIFSSLKTCLNVLCKLCAGSLSPFLSTTLVPSLELNFFQFHLLYAPSFTRSWSCLYVSFLHSLFI